MQRLLHRWFVEYNPIYLVSAMLVLGGATLASRGLVHDGSVYGPLGVALVAEVYSAALILGAALLTRIGQRRPGVLLAMITVVYQCDLTLHTETCAYLGAVGIFASTAWFAIFAVKLRALAWAVKIRISHRAFATASLGAFALAAAPFALQNLDARASGMLVSLIVISLGSLRPRASDEAVTSDVALDDWGRTVLRRSTRVTWALWGALLALHVLFWASQRSINLFFTVPAFLFLAQSRVQRESRVWSASIAILAFTLFVAPSAFSLCAVFAAITLARRAFSRVPAITTTDASATHDPSPYRAAEPDDAAREAASPDVVTLVPIDASARARLLSGAVFALYLSIWGFAYRGGAFPNHVLALDLAFIAATFVLSWRTRARVPFVPLAATLAHALAVSGRVPTPHSPVGWGALIIAVGFLLLFGSLATSYRLRHHDAPKID